MLSEFSSILRLNNTPSYCLFIHLLVDTLGLLWAIVNSGHGYSDSCSTSCFNSLGYIPRIGIAGSNGNSSFNFLRNCHTVFHSSCTILVSQQEHTSIPISLYPSEHLLFLFFFYSSHSNACKVVSHLVLICISLKISDAEHLCICWLAYIFLKKMSVHIL